MNDALEKLARSLDKFNELFPSWESFAIYFAIALLGLETFICVRQWRLRTAFLTATGNNYPTRSDKLKGTAAYNLVHCMWSLGRVFYIYTFKGIPFLWNLAGKFQVAYLPAISPRANDFLQNLIFVLACGVAYLLLHAPDYSGQMLMKNENAIKNLRQRWTIKNFFKDISTGHTVYPVMILCLVEILAIKTFSARVTRILQLSAMVLQIIFVIFYPMLSQPKERDLVQLEDETLVASIIEIAETAKMKKLKGIYVSEGPLDDVEQGVQVFGWPRKNNIVIHRSILNEFTPEDVKALVTRALGGWQKNISFASFFCSNIMVYNVMTQIIIFIGSIDSYKSFGLESKDGSYPVAAMVVIWGIGFARIWQIYVSLFLTNTNRKLAWAVDKYVAEQGQSLALSAVLTKIQALKGESGCVDIFYAFFYNEGPLICERLAWLEKDRKEEEKKEGMIKLPVGDEIKEKLSEV